ncbi:MAG: biotin--[acetyl-CoA-carboxylase] ligase [Clostridiales bacterium GWE2_32_10]|nr:MAG: biotin--[acetyl-CoA-carboxylase] ligase [Clostridiales bacterium GWE2_32_10]HBY19731.1 biotin--[acetyl-CoA-carboxylase] ligase [Clostridiales bacterium]
MKFNPTQTEMQEYKTIATDNIIFYNEIDSTNEEAKRLIRTDKLNEDAIVAEFQTAGKGTQGKSWASTSGKNILMTVVLKTKQEISEVQKITLIAGMSVYQVLGDYVDKDNMKIKWPNDIHINGKKICGILTESIRYNDELYLIIGIGVNINTKEFEEISGNVPTSLLIETGEIFSRKKIVLEIVDRIKENYNKYIVENGEFIEEYQNFLSK